MQTTIIIAAYNEGPAIGGVIRGLLAAGYGEIVVVDDGSADDTGEQAYAAGAAVLTHAINLGQGAALQTGMEYAVRQGAEYVVTFDADGQHCVEDIAPAIAALRETQADIALGSRFLGRAVNLPRRRHLVLKAAIVFTAITTGIRLTDAHNGFRVLTRGAASRIRLKQNRMAHASEFIERIRALDLRYMEVPVTIVYSAYSLRKGQRLGNLFNILSDIVARKI